MAGRFDRKRHGEDSDAAVEVFTEVGFAAADRGAIIERTGHQGAFTTTSTDGTAGVGHHRGRANLVVAELSTMSDCSPRWRTSCTARSSPRNCSHEQGRAHRRGVDRRSGVNEKVGAATDAGPRQRRCRPAGRSPKATYDQTRREDGQRINHRRDVRRRMIGQATTATTISFGDLPRCGSYCSPPS